ncbi:hypothetical protein K7X08_027632 [Anisodus acutangulus]|uniref:Uncharacterized protein n=1 Tax=Anisodus acutangulus TaxID=402998 RepID=A0A9Q1MJ99_9SOLA|nr:hypothetical protein K7X08_027632 [Anisodus acutangulus]
MERYRDKKIAIEKFALSISASNYHRPLVIPWIDKWLGIALQNGVKDMVSEVSVPSYPFPVSTFLASKSLRELDLTGCDLSLSTSQVAKCHSLRKLSLTNVRLDDNLLQTMLTCCPLIVDFIIVRCPLLTKIELRNLQNIKSVSISISYSHQIESVKIQAPTLEHLSYCGWGESTVLDIIECQNLRSLKLSHMKISEGFLQHLISTFQFLESLILVRFSGELGKFNICGSQSLKNLGICSSGDIGEIDASNLVSFEYMGTEIPELKIAKESGQLKNSKTYLYCSNDLNAAWFCEFRKFLSNLTSWSQVSLYFKKCNEINMEDLHVHHSITTPQVDVLNVSTSEDKRLVSREQRWKNNRVFQMQRWRSKSKSFREIMEKQKSFRIPMDRQMSFGGEMKSGKDSHGKRVDSPLHIAARAGNLGK